MQWRDFAQNRYLFCRFQSWASILAIALAMSGCIKGKVEANWGPQQPGTVTKGATPSPTSAASFQAEISGEVQSVPAAVQSRLLVAQFGNGNLSSTTSNAADAPLSHALIQILKLGPAPASQWQLVANTTTDANGHYAAVLSNVGPHDVYLSVAYLANISVGQTLVPISQATSLSLADAKLLKFTADINIANSLATSLILEHHVDLQSVNSQQIASTAQVASQKLSSVLATASDTTVAGLANALANDPASQSALAATLPGYQAAASTSPSTLTDFGTPQPPLTASSAGSTDKTAPVTGGNGILTSTTATPNSLTISWSPATDDTTPANALGYLVYVSSQPMDQTTIAQGRFVGEAFGQTQVTIGGLGAGQTFNIGVIVEDQAGNTAAYNVLSAATQASNDTATTAPPAPVGLVATAGNANVALSWTAVSGATSYTVKRSTTSGAAYTIVAPSVAATTYADFTALNGTTYYYVVSATNAVGTGDDSSEVSATPLAPTGNFSITSANAGDGQVVLSWSAATGATSYTVKRGTSSGSYPTTLSTNATSPYTDSTATNGTTYYYMVIATGTGGSTNASAEASATPLAAPTTPTALAATAGNANVSLSWTAVTGAATYTIKRSTTSGSGYTTLSSTVSSNSYADLTALNGTTYYYVVSATNTSGTSAYSSEVSATPTTAPGTFSISSATPGDSQVVVSWGASTNASSFTVKRGTSSGSYPTTLSTNATSPYTDSTATNGTTYYYMVIATGTGGSTNASAEASATPLAVPTTPTSLAATAGNASVSLSWTAVTGAATYTVKRSTTSGSGYTTLSSTVSSASYADLTALNGTTYYYVVSATNTSGTSANSSEVSATPGAVPTLSYAGASGTVGAVGYAMSIAPTTLSGNGMAITGCALKSGSNALPSGLTIDTSTCVISGTPTAVQSSTTVTIVASNAKGTSADATVSLIVQDWWNPAWSMRQKVVINNSAQSSGLTNFPALVVLDSTKVSYGNFQNNGADIRFVASDDATALNFEIEHWNAAGKSYIWVKIPSIPAASNAGYIWMYYGNAAAADGQNATGVWGSFAGVWHLNGALSDSTSNASNGTNNGSTDSVGEVYDGRTFDGVSNYISVPNQSLFNFTSTLTISTWINVSSFSKTWQAILTKGDHSWALSRYNSTNNLSFGTYPGTWNELQGATNVNDGKWHYITAVLNGSTKTLYMDGNVDASSTGNSANQADSYNVYFGENGEATGRQFAGQLDEVRLSGSAMSADWVKADYLTQTDAFLTYGTLEMFNGTKPLNAFSAATGFAHDGDVDLSITFPGDTSNYSYVKVLRTPGSTSPACNDNTATVVASSITNFSATWSNTDATGTAGSPFAYTACVYDSGNNLLTNSTATATSKLFPITCDSGSIDTTCTISSTKALSSGAALTGNGGILLSGSGALNCAGSCTIHIKGDLQVDAASTASVSGIATISAANFKVPSGSSWTSSSTIASLTVTNTFEIDGTMSGDITSASVGTALVNGTLTANLPSFSATTFTIASGASVSADGRGSVGVYQANSTAQGAGSGSGGSGGGGSHAGTGGNGNNNTAGSTTIFGSASQPTTYGGAGGAANTTGAAGGNGGGAIKLIISGTLTVNGKLTANGMPGNVGSFGDATGAGAGGSLWLNVGGIGGSGQITAQGGNGITSNNLSGGGGGGRIALYSPTKFIGTISVAGGAYGGGGTKAGQAGSFYSTVPASAICDSGDINSTCTVSSTVYLGDNQTYTISGNLVVASGGSLKSLGSAPSNTLTVSGDLTVQTGGSVSAPLFSTLNANNLTVQSGASFNAPITTLSVTNTFEVDGTMSGDITSASVGAALVNGTLTANLPSFSATTFTIASGASVSADGRGSAGLFQTNSTAQGAGAGLGGSGGGGSHAGTGGNGTSTNTGSTTIFGSASQPTTYGGPGGAANTMGAAGGNGGGAIKLIVSGTLTVNGKLTANGMPGNVGSYGDATGAGAGGSLWLNVGGMGGNGQITAQGGNGVASGNFSGGGGGGRIALYSPAKFIGTISVAGGAYGGASATAGQAGSFYSTVPASAICDSGDITSTCTVSSNVYLGDNQTYTISGNLVVASGGSLKSLGSAPANTLTVSGDLTVQTGGSVSAPLLSNLSANNLTVQSSASFNAPITALSVTNTFEVDGTMSGDIASASVGTALINGTLTANLPSFSATTFTIASGASVSADGRGSAGLFQGTSTAQGAGSGSSGSGGGGSHAGTGGNGTSTNTGSTTIFGSASQPTTYGGAGGAVSISGAFGGNGGGAIKLIVSGTLTVNGKLTANGMPGNVGSFGNATGAGAGGSLWLNVGGMGGNGQITAQGGNGITSGSLSGGGGGGRIALYSPAKFIGTISVAGGSSGGGKTTAGQAGSFYSTTPASAICDSGDLSTTCTLSTVAYFGDNQSISGSGDFVLASGASLRTLGAAAASTISMSGNLVVQSGATISGPMVSAISANNFTIQSGGTMAAPIGTLTVTGTMEIDGTLSGDITSANVGTLNVTGSMKGNLAGFTASTATIASGALLSADNLGYAATSSTPGSGVGSSGSCGGGGAYGGSGGWSTDGKSGGSANGSSSQPASYGSAGGNGNAVGGNGGGAIKLTVTNTLTVNGTVSANGQAGFTASIYAGGGGAGGSLWLSASGMAGSGTIEALGGDGAVSGWCSGGGGSGGRVAIYSSVPFRGTISLAGGSTTNTATQPQAGSYYANFPSSSLCDTGDVTTTCTLSSKVTLGDNQTVTTTGDLVVASGGQLNALGAASAAKTAIGGSLTVQSGGSIAATLFDTIGATNFNIDSGASVTSAITTLAITGTATINGSLTGTITSATVNTINVSGTITGNLYGFAANTFNIASGGVVTATGLGYQGGIHVSGQGPGAPGCCQWSSPGASYGGLGSKGNSGAGLGATYGNAQQPTQWGSSGGGETGDAGSAGGGAIKIVTTGTFTNNGTLSADGKNGSNASGQNWASGAGSGGSLWLDVGAFSGNGVISANGGNGATNPANTSTTSGAGGGGRIAMYTTNSFGGTVTANGGTSSGTAAGNGTVNTYVVNTNYHKVFASSVGYSGGLTLAQADTNCASLAQAAGFPASIGWKSLLSTSTTDAASRFSILGPVINTRGDFVANDSSGFWSGTLLLPVRYTEAQVDAGATGVWTGSTAAGLKTTSTCSDWSDGTSASTGTVGVANATGTTWLNQSTPNCASSYSIYCVSQ